MQSGMSRREAIRERILALFPDGEGTYELIYAPRFRRLLDEFTKPDAPSKGVIIPFPARPR
jgi:hypothetical protein